MLTTTHPVDTANNLRSLLMKNAVISDEKATFSLESCEALGDLFGLTIPVKYGGLGANAFIQTQVLESLAQGDPAVALYYAMHTTVVSFVAEFGSPNLQNSLFSEIIKGKENLIAAATSEPGASFQGPFEMQTTFTPNDNGYSVRGDKHFCSIGRYAKRYLVLGKIPEKNPGPARIIAAVIPREKATLIRSWENYKPRGMRGTSSDRIRFDAFVPQENLIGTPGQLVQSGHFGRFALCYAAVYTGIAQSALTYLRETLSPKKLGACSQELEEIDKHITHIHSLIACAACAFEENPLEATLPILEAKLAATKEAVSILRAACEIVGGKSNLESECPLGRLERDASCGALMPPSNRVCRQKIPLLKAGQKIPAIEWV